MGDCFRGRGLGFVNFSREERLIPRGLSHGRPPVLFRVGLPRRLVGLLCLLLCSFSVVCSFLVNFLSAMYLYFPGTYYVVALLGPQGLKNEDKALIFVPICKLRSHSTVD